MGNCAVEHILVGHHNLGNLVFFELTHVTRSDTPPLLDNHLAVFAGQFKSGDFTAQPGRLELKNKLVIVAQAKRGGVKEHLQHFLGAETHGAQQDSHRQLSATVDTNIDQVFGVKLEVEPGTAIGNDARRIQKLARRMRLAFVVIKKHAGRTMQLGDNNALGTVDNKGTVVGHQGDLPHVHFLLLNILDRFAGRILIDQHQPHAHAQRHSVGSATQLTFFNIKYRLAEFVIDVFEAGITGIALDGEHGVKRCMQSSGTTVFQRNTFLGELSVGVELYRQQVWLIHHLRQFAKTLSNAFFLSVRISHQFFPACLAFQKPRSVCAESANDDPPAAGRPENSGRTSAKRPASQARQPCHRHDAGCPGLA